jgi:hypothetical protein
MVNAFELVALPSIDGTASDEGNPASVLGRFGEAEGPLDFCEDTVGSGVMALRFCCGDESGEALSEFIAACGGYRMARRKKTGRMTYYGIGGLKTSDLLRVYKMSRFAGV